MSALGFPCPIDSCSAKVGEPCKTRLTRAGFVHAPRLHRAEHESRGPQALDVVYLEGLKYRVASVAPLKLKRGNSHTLFNCPPREELCYDPIAGMWREAVPA